MASDPTTKRPTTRLPDCAVDRIRGAASWAREVAEAERERARTDKNPLQRSVAADCAVQYDILARIAELFVEDGAPTRVGELIGSVLVVQPVPDGGTVFHPMFMQHSVGPGQYDLYARLVRGRAL